MGALRWDSGLPWTVPPVPWYSGIPWDFDGKLGHPSKVMEGQSGLSEFSTISWVSAVEKCPLSRVPLYLPKVTNA